MKIPMHSYALCACLIFNNPRSSFLPGSGLNPNFLSYFYQILETTVILDTEIKLKFTLKLCILSKFRKKILIYLDLHITDKKRVRIKEYNIKIVVKLCLYQIV